MRLMTWNCRGGLKNKRAVIDTINPDVVILQEGSLLDVENLAGFNPHVCQVKVGDETGKKSLAVICLNPEFTVLPANLPTGWNSLVQNEPGRLDVLAPVEISGPVSLNLLAVWSFNNRNHPNKRNLEGPLLCALRLLSDWARSSPLVVAGDFNHTPEFDRYTNANQFHKHLAFFDDLNLESLYHYFSGETFGEESKPTHLWRNQKPFMIDYIFANPHVWSESDFQLMDFEELELLNVKSDHVPLWVDLS